MILASAFAFRLPMVFASVFASAFALAFLKCIGNCNVWTLVFEFALVLAFALVFAVYTYMKYIIMPCVINTPIKCYRFYYIYYYPIFY